MFLPFIPHKMNRICCFVLAVFLISGLFAQAQGQANPSSTETPFAVKTLSASLSGTLTIPDGVSGKVPVVLIISGTGPIDRNGNSEKLRISSNAYKLLAGDLAKGGIASFRYDKRMVGQSHAGGDKEDNLRFDDYVDDAIGVINSLKEDKRFSKIIVLGHAEGALVGMLAAADTEDASNAYISIDGVGRHADVYLKEQMKSQAAYISDGFNKIMDSLRVGSVQKKVDISLYQYIRPNIQNYLISWIRFDPTDEIRNVKKPILIIQGTSDLQIPVIDGDKLKRSKSSATYTVLRGMNYVFRDAPVDKEKNLATYNQPELPLKPELVTAIVDFVKGLK